MLFSSIINRLQKTPVKLILKPDSVLEDGSPIGGSPAVSLLEIPASVLVQEVIPDSNNLPYLLPYFISSTQETIGGFSTYTIRLNAKAIFSNFDGVKITGKFSATKENDRSIKNINIVFENPIGDSDTITNAGQLAPNTGLKINSEGRINFFFEAEKISKSLITLRIYGSPLFNASFGNYIGVIDDKVLLSDQQSGITARYEFVTSPATNVNPHANYYPKVIKPLAEKENTEKNIHNIYSPDLKMEQVEIEEIKEYRIKLRVAGVTDLPSFVSYAIVNPASLATSTLSKSTEIIHIDMVSLYLNSATAPTEIALGVAPCTADVAFPIPAKDITSITGILQSSGTDRVAFFPLGGGFSNNQTGWFINDPTNNRGKRMFLNIRGLTSFTTLELSFMVRRLHLLNN
jgi:hypothetical protein